MASPHFRGQPHPSWADITRALVAQHPLFREPGKLLNRINAAWVALWATRVGAAPLEIPFAELQPRAQLVGDFFENLLALALAKGGHWRRGASSEKDLIYTGPERGDFDTEIKTSGQRGGYIYGNRSYAQPDRDGKLVSATRKKRAGYYLCVNFFGSAIFRVRVGWIDAEDWVPQKSPTGQMAGLKPYVYEYKLLEVPGEYYLGAPLIVVDGIGPHKVRTLAEAKIECLGDVAERLKRAALGPAELLSLRPSDQARVLGVEPEVADLVRVVVQTQYFGAAWEFA